MAAAYAGHFADSSALVKRYVQEVGTSWVRRLTRHSPFTVIYIARITAVEVTSAVARRRKVRTLTSKKAASIPRRFRQHLAGRYTIIEITPALVEAAMRLANTHSLRAYDAVQLAAACGSRLALDADGPDAEAALEVLTDLIGRRFDEES